VAAIAGAVLVGVSILLLRQAETPLPATSSTALSAPAPKVVTVEMTPDPEAFVGMQEIQRFQPQTEGLKTQFVSALPSLEPGAVSQEQFVDGLEKWVLPQWRVLDNQLGAAPVVSSSARYTSHEQMAKVVSLWIGALETYSRGLREHDPAGSLAAFADMRRASELEWDVRHWYDILEQQSRVGVPRPSP